VSSISSAKRGNRFSCAVEGLHVLLCRLRAERRGVVVAKLRERLGAGFNEVHEVAVQLLRVLTRRTVVGVFRVVALLDQLSLLTLEQVQLAADDI
jgi:hypothetical protein